MYSRLLLMISESKATRGGKDPRSRFLKATSLTACNPPTKKPAAKKAAAKKKKSAP
jgi:hypothetical protein